jgi:predicted Zn-dependent protease
MGVLWVQSTNCSPARIVVKLYAALIADAEAHLQGGEAGTGVVELERAARLLPERPEAWALLAQLATSATS